jgi:hypothetical protein
MRTGKPKRRWATPTAAQFVADWQTNVKHNPTTWYQCPTCEQWHVTSERDPGSAQGSKRRDR